MFASTTLCLLLKEEEKYFYVFSFSLYGSAPQARLEHPSLVMQYNLMYLNFQGN
jgi:hypothetical protein